MSAMTAEVWWTREVTTTELDWLADELCRRTGRPRTAAGTKGNEAHNSGGHRSQEWILNSRFCDDRRYTVQVGLTNMQARHIAGLDFTPGSVTKMVEQCQRLMAAMKAGVLEEVREMYGNVDGDKVVDGWDNVRNRAATSDASHLWHWHLTFDRRCLTDRALMQRIIAIVMGDPVDLSADTIDKIATQTAAKTWAYVLPATATPGHAARSASVAVGDIYQRQMSYHSEVMTAIKALAAAGGVDIDEAAIVSGVLAGLTPELAAALPDDLAQRIVTVLGERLAPVAPTS